MDALYSRPCTLPEFPFKVVAFDTETTLFTPPRLDARGKTRLSPFEHPYLVLGSFAYDGKVEVFHREECLEKLRSLLEGGYHIVCHNLSFDAFVVDRADRGCGDLLIDAVAQNLVTDTKHLEQLLFIARGSASVDDKVLKSYRLAELAERRAGMTLDKESGIRTDFGRYRLPDIPIPRAYLEYAAQDAEATFRVFHSQFLEAQIRAILPVGNRYPVFSDASDRFGILTSRIQCQAALAFAWLEGFPLRVDLPALEALRSRYVGESKVLQDALVKFGFARRDKNGKFSMANKVLREKLAIYAAEHGITPTYSDTAGVLSLAYDDWRAHIPAGDPARLANPLELTSFEEQLQAWLRFTRLRKLTSTYLDVYGTGPDHYASYWVLGARTGRTSCSRPNLQQIPKKGKDGKMFRKLYIPSPGRVFIEADFAAAELVALAEVYFHMFGGSALGDRINAGRDPHTELARKLAGEAWDTMTTGEDGEQKRARQAAKAANFGLPGGMGAERFRQRYRELKLSISEARLFRKEVLAADPELRRYLTEYGSEEALLRTAARNLMLPFEKLISALEAWRYEAKGEVHWGLAAARLRKWSYGDDEYEVPAPEGFNRKWDLFRSPSVTLTGRVRGRCTYTQAHNLPFQGLVADACKIATWHLFLAHREDPTWFAPVAMVHDSLLIEVDEDRVADGRALLERCMLAGMSETCPNIKARADVNVLGKTWAGPEKEPAHALTPAAG